MGLNLGVHNTFSFHLLDFMIRRILLLLVIFCLSLLSTRETRGVPSQRYHTFHVVDQQTGRGVPLVELRTVGNVSYYTDSKGYVAFFEPGLMQQQLYFHVSSHGYLHEKDGFGYRGFRTIPTPGKITTVKLERLNIAERLYRITGEGIYRDTVLLGLQPPLKQPVLNAQVFGSDSTVNAVYRNQVYWFWGDTNRASYPLGNFHVPGATSPLMSPQSTDPSSGINLSYFVDNAGFAKKTCEMPGTGPTWLDGLVVLENAAGTEQLFGAYAKVKAPLTIYERGLVQWDDELQQFNKITTFNLTDPLYPKGHPFIHATGTTNYIYFADPYPYVRVRMDLDALKQAKQYESYTCFEQGARADHYSITRNQNGEIQYAWKKDTLPLTHSLQEELIRTGQISREEGLFQTADSDTGAPLTLQRGSVYWNAYRQRWIMIGCQYGGTSVLGEIWFAESPQLVGPWKWATKIVSHDHYSFYNPKQQPMFDQQGGRLIYFEGTYTTTFSKATRKTPRYDYNQIMYRLDLADPRLHTRDKK